MSLEKLKTELLKNLDENQKRNFEEIIQNSQSTDELEKVRADIMKDANDEQKPKIQTSINKFKKDSNEYGANNLSGEQ